MTINQPLCIAGLSIITSTEEAFKENTIGKLWNNFLNSSIKEKLKNSLLSDNIYAVYSDYENGHKGKYRTTIGYSINQTNHLSDKLTTVIVPAGNYKIYQTRNQPEAIISTWQRIWEMDPKIIPRNYVADFEEYNGEDVKIFIGYV